MKIHDIALVIFVVSLATLAVVHEVAMQWSIYRIYPWFDILMHFWGGSLVALGSNTMFFRKLFRIHPWNLVSTLALVLLVGGVWEVFEWYSGISGVVAYLSNTIQSYEWLFLFDTTKDIVMDLVGGTVGYYVAHSLNAYTDHV